jgi:hypothetical protein
VYFSTPNSWCFPGLLARLLRFGALFYFFLLC